MPALNGPTVTDPTHGFGTFTSGAPGIADVNCPALVDFQRRQGVLLRLASGLILRAGMCAYLVIDRRRSFRGRPLIIFFALRQIVTKQRDRRLARAASGNAEYALRDFPQAVPVRRARRRTASGSARSSLHTDFSPRHILVPAGHTASHTGILARGGDTRVAHPGLMFQDVSNL
ncbi:hypothetical protein ACFSTC_18300 [Nonomuraea ferruginea]